MRTITVPKEIRKTLTLEQRIMLEEMNDTNTLFDDFEMTIKLTAEDFFNKWSKKKVSELYSWRKQLIDDYFESYEEVEAC